MLKNISNLGSILTKTEQNSINGGGIITCYGSGGEIHWTSISNSSAGDLGAINNCITNYGGSTVAPR